MAIILSNLIGGLKELKGAMPPNLASTSSRKGRLEPLGYKKTF